MSMWGRKHNFTPTPVGSGLRPKAPYLLHWNNKQMNRRKINRHFIACIPPVYMGETQAITVNNISCEKQKMSESAESGFQPQHIRGLVVMWA